MAETEFVSVRIAIGLYANLTIKEEAMLPFYKQLLDFPEFDGFSSYSPPRSFMDSSTTLGTLTSSSNVIKADISRQSIALSWTNATRAANYDFDQEAIEDLVARAFEAMKHEIGGVAVFREYFVKASKAHVEGIFATKRQERLASFAVNLAYPDKIGQFDEVDVNYAVTDVITDSEWAAAFSDYKYLLSANTSMRYVPDRVLELAKIKDFVSEVLKVQVGAKLLADITDGGQ